MAAWIGDLRRHTPRAEVLMNGAAAPSAALRVFRSVHSGIPQGNQPVDVQRESARGL